MSMASTMEKEKKIVKINDINIITNGTPEDLATIKNPNEVGEVVDKDGVVISNITPIIMIINMNSKNLEECLDILNKNGGDFNKKINYYGSLKSANDILKINNPGLHYNNIYNH